MHGRTEKYAASPNPTRVLAQLRGLASNAAVRCNLRSAQGLRAHVQRSTSDAQGRAGDWAPYRENEIVAGAASAFVETVPREAKDIAPT